MLLLLTAAALYCLISGGTAFGLSGVDKKAEAVSWHISALKATYDSERDLFLGKGDVVITGGTTRLEADYVEFNNATKEAFATGHVLLISGEDAITANSIQINLAMETGTIYKGSVFIQESNFHIKGDEINKTGKNTYEADQATLTSCNPDNPDWKISGKEIKVTIEGYGFAKHATFWTKNIPAVYSPFLAFPVKTKRQTGLLAPKFSSSEKKGFEFEQPLFIALSRSMDASLYLHHMTQRGTKLGLEYRYLFGNGSEGMLLYDYLDDSKIDNGSPATQEYRFDSTPIRENRDRYWFRMKHDQILPAKWRATLDIDYVSDADYLHEFDSGYTGFDTTNTRFENKFGRSLDGYDDTVRENRLNISRIWSVYSINAGINWYDDIIARQFDLADTTMQKLPTLQLSSVRQPVGRLPLQVDLNAEHTVFHREDTTDTLITGQRTDIHPRLYWPVTIGNRFWFEPSLGIRQTLWHADDFKDTDGKTETFHHRELYDLNLELSTRLSKVFNTQNKFAEKIKHEITPMIQYSNVPDRDQENFPYFDADDRVERQNHLTWALVNRFIAKQKSPNKANGLKRADDKQSYDYKEIAWVKVSQSYDIHEQRTDGEDKEPFSDISADVELFPCNYLMLDADAEWSPYDNRFTSRNAGITLKDQRGDAFYASHRYERASSESLYARLDAVVSPEINAFISYEEDLYLNKRVESQLGLNLKKSCWSLMLSYSDKPDDQSITFLVNLYGIGEFGKR